LNYLDLYRHKIENLEPTSNLTIASSSQLLLTDSNSIIASTGIIRDQVFHSPNSKSQWIKLIRILECTLAHLFLIVLH